MFGGFHLDEIHFISFDADRRSLSASLTFGKVFCICVLRLVLDLALDWS